MIRAIARNRSALLAPGTAAARPASVACPICAEFEHRFGEGITALAEKNQVKLVFHTLSFLDDNLRNDSSNRAANAAAWLRPTSDSGGSARPSRSPRALASVWP